MKLMKWWRQSVHFMHAENRDRRLVVVVSRVDDGVCMIISIESGINNASPLAVFDDHAHEVVGQAKTIAGACRLGSAYARKWLKAAPKKRCACKSIKKRRTLRKSRASCRACHA